MAHSSKSEALSAKAILFDLDGTLVDTAQDFIYVLNKQRQRHHLSPIQAKIIRERVSDGARALTKLAFGGEPGEEAFEARREELLELYGENVGKEALLFEGMDQTLQYFESQNIAWGIVTNKPKRFTSILIDKLSLTERCAISLSPEDVRKAKPDPESLLLACERLNFPPSEVVYVGDHERDIIAGKAAGMKTIAASYGYMTNRQTVIDWQADYIIDHPKHLPSLFSNS